MKSEWEIRKLSQLGQIIGGGTPKTSNPAFWNGDIPWLSVKDFCGDTKHVYKTEKTITEFGVNNSSTKLLQKDDIILSARGTIGEMAMLAIPMAFNQSCFGLRANGDVDAHFLYYLLKYKVAELKKVAHGSIFETITRESFDKVECEYPPLPTQRKIAAILSALDDKIENNNAIRKNLEEQLKCLFNLRFRDMIDSRGMSQYTPLASLCERITKGTTPTTLGLPFVDEGINFIKAESITDKHIFDWHRFAKIGPDTHTALNRSQLSENDILFSIAGTLGRFALVDKTILPANTNQAVAIIRADKNKVEPEYLYSFFLAGWHHVYCQKRVQQAVQANLSLTTIKSMQIIMLDGPARREYVAQISPIMQMISQRQLENRALAILRDTLLPKLMSGEINVDTVCAH